MTETFWQDDMDSHAEAPRDSEGAFDAQMSLPLPFLEPPPPFQTVIKRDGRQEPFRKIKITEAIFKAAQSIGGQDRALAESLASAVTIYLLKRLNNQPPTVDHVHDAVERVLIQMAHARTALAYARYRDRRDRIRRLRRGDMKELLGELEEARHDRDAVSGQPNRLLSVRTSGDTLEQWDRSRIVRALTQETDLEPSLAEVIAAEVEEQVARADIRTLTTALVRELVSAKLVEHGFEEAHNRHRRLGVPFYDADHLIRGLAPESLGQPPLVTDQLIAGAVKKEYAFAHVFSPEVAEAHLRGDLHLLHPEQIDRLLGAELSAERLFSDGLGVLGSARYLAAPGAPQECRAVFAHAQDWLQPYFSEGISWSALNRSFAPFLTLLSTPERAEYVRALVEEARFGASADAPGMTWELLWPVRGAAMHPAQEMALNVLSLLAKEPVPGLTVRVCVDPAALNADGHDTFLLRAVEAALGGQDLSVAFRRDAAEDDAAPHLTAQQVTINLPRAAYLSGTEARLHEVLRAWVAVAVSAHRQKMDFIEAMADPASERPLAGLSRLLNLPAPPVEPRCFTGLIVVDGLFECVAALLGGDAGKRPEEAAALAGRILAYLRDLCRERARVEGMRLELGANAQDAISRRFAALDARAFPKTAAATLGDALQYTTGATLGEESGLNPVQRLLRAGELHDALEGRAEYSLAVPRPAPQPAALVDTLKIAAAESACRGLRFQRIDP